MTRADGIAHVLALKDQGFTGIVLRLPDGRDVTVADRLHEPAGVLADVCGPADALLIVSAEYPR